MPWLSWMMKSACCASSTSDHTGCVTAIASAGMSAAMYARISWCRRTTFSGSGRISFAVDAQDAEEEARENRLHAKGEQNRGGDDLTHRQPRVEGSEPDSAPAQDGKNRAGRAEQEHQRPKHEPGLELYVTEHLGIGSVWRMEAFAHREHFREDCEHDELVADQAAEASVQQRVDVEADRPDRFGSNLNCGTKHQP